MVTILLTLVRTLFMTLTIGKSTQMILSFGEKNIWLKNNNLFWIKFLTRSKVWRQTTRFDSGYWTAPLSVGRCSIWWYKPRGVFCRINKTVSGKNWRKTGSECSRTGNQVHASNELSGHQRWFRFSRLRVHKSKSFNFPAEPVLPLYGDSMSPRFFCFKDLIG